MMTVLAVVTFLGVAWMMAQLLGARGVIVELGREPFADAAVVSPVSVVVAARDEAHGIEAGVLSLLRQEPPLLEVTVVDDRSSDETPRILARLAAQHPRLRVRRVDDLPAGWLGKNHALHLGASEAAGELILFTDADVVMEPSTVARAVEYLERERLDHLTLGPRIVTRGWLLESFVVVFGVMFTLFTRPWRVSDPRDRAHVGIGAFNLVRAAAYRAAGGHEPIRMRPDDDLKLGKLLKREGFRQGFASGVGLVSVEWYPSAADAVRGLRKNAFCGMEYRVSGVILSSMLALGFLVWPFAAVFLVAGPARWAYAASVAILLAMYAGGARHLGVSPWRALAFPAAGVMLVVVLWNSMLYTLWHRGIEWRGTHYPLRLLRENRV